MLTSSSRNSLTGLYLILDPSVSPTRSLGDGQYSGLTHFMTSDEFVIEGIKTTIPLHHRILDDPDFPKGHVSTTFLERFLAS